MKNDASNGVAETAMEPAVIARPSWFGSVSGSVRNLDQYFGFWALQDDIFRAAVGRLQGFNLSAHVEAASSVAPRGAYRGDDYQIEPGGVAVIDISGPMMKYTSSLSDGTSTVRVRRQLANAVENESVKQIVLRIDSPGGTVAGTEDLAAAVRNAASSKPVTAFIEDLGASAAYWVASQASAIYAAGKTTLVGSIGTYGVLYDYSAQAAMLGVKVHVVHAGEFKGSGIEGTEITEKQLAEWQRIINRLNEQFLAGVSSGRKLSSATTAELADGRVHDAEDALKLRLIDGIQSFEATLSNIRTTGPRRKNAMSNTENATPTAKAAASYEDLKACLPGADSEFICKQLERKATLDQSQSAWMEEQQRRIDIQKDETKRLKEAQESKAGIKPLGEKSPGTASSTWDDPAAEWAKRIDAEVARGHSRAQASSRVNRQCPGLREAVVEAANSDRR
jgi:signal peptide peptidase SppA